MRSKSFIWYDKLSKLIHVSGKLIKSTIFGLAFLLFLGGIFFPKELVSKCVAWQASRYCKKAFGANFDYDSLVWQSGALVFTNGKLHKEDELDATFEKATLFPFINFRERTFGGKLDLVGLKIVHQKKELHPVLNPPSPSYKFLTFKLDTTIQSGELLLHDHLSKNFFSQKAYFDLTHHVLGARTSGTISFKFQQDTSLLIMHFCNDEGAQLRLNTQFQEQSFPCLSHLITYFFQTYLQKPTLQWDILSGTVNGNLDVTLIKGQPLKMRGKVGLHNVQGENIPLKLLAEIDQINCELDIDFSTLNSINGSFDLNGGRVAILQDKIFWQDMWNLKNVQSYICIKEGKIEQSLLKANYMGMEGEIVFDWHASEIVMQMGFRGVSKNMIHFLPEKIQNSFATAFPEDLFNIDACVLRSSEGLELNGTLVVQDQKQMSYKVAFGCLLGCENNVEMEVVFPEKLNFSLSRSVDSFLDHLRQQFCLSHKRFGWFRGEHLPLEKFLSPFLLQKVPMTLSGCTNLKATFDEKYLVIFYEGEDIELQSPHFMLHVDAVSERVSPDIMAVHYFDLSTWNHVGFLPLKKAAYWQKNYDFHLENVHAVVNFENNQIRIQNITTQSEGLDFGGDVDITIHALDSIDLKICVDHLKGSLGSARNFLRHFKPSLFCEIPFEGNLIGYEKSIWFYYHFSPAAHLIEGNLQGEISFNYFHSAFSLKDYRTTLHYDCVKNQLQLSEGKGMLCLPKRGAPIDFMIPTLSLSDFPDFQFDFCCKLQDEAEILTLNGSSHKKEKAKEIIVTGKTEQEKEKIYIKSLQEKNHLEIVEFICDQWKGSAALNLHKDHVEITHFSCAANQEMSFSLTGEYNLAQRVLHGDLTCLKLNLNGISPMLSRWKPSGEINGTGSFFWKIGEDIAAQAHLNFQHLEFGGIYFGSGEDLSCCYTSSNGFTVEGLQAEIPLGQAAEKYKLGRFHYDFQKQKILFEGFDFSLPPEKLPWVAKTASELFPGKFHTVKFDWVEAIKRNEPLEGRLCFEADPDNIRIYLNLKDGSYYLSDQQLDLKNIHLIYDPHELHIWSQAIFRNHDYILHLIADSETLSTGSLSLSEGEGENCPGNCEQCNGLVATWAREQENRWLIKKIEGVFCGMDVALIKADGADMCLEGHIGFDPVKLHPLLNPTWKKCIENLGLAGGYALEGRWIIDKSDFSNTSFKGEVFATNWKIKNITLDAASGALEIAKNFIKFSDFTVKDWAGQLLVHEALLKRNGDSFWELTLDQLMVENLRLSRLKSPWTQWSSRNKPFYRSLFIPSFVLEKVAGDPLDINSFAGSGNVEFTNLPKKTFFSNLLFVPTEITARIGLDLSNLIPVRGTILYEIKNGKIYFNEFKDMYSDGKRSRFYLAEGSDAFIDFKGKLNFKVKTKQYNLFMKLAEFFTISIKGTLLRPSYTFSSHTDAEDSV